MKAFILLVLVAGCVAVLACAPSRPATDAADAAAANAGIDSLNAHLVDAYRRRDPAAYGALYSDSALFEWPAFNTVRGPAALAAMARDNWTGQRDVELRLRVAQRVSPPITPPSSARSSSRGPTPRGCGERSSAGTLASSAGGRTGAGGWIGSSASRTPRASTGAETHEQGRS
jgi:hypothetical protein